MNRFWVLGVMAVWLMQPVAASATDDSAGAPRVSLGVMVIALSDIGSGSRACWALEGVTHGVPVSKVRPASTAERMGIEAGDVLIALDGRPLHEPAGLVRAVRALSLGDTVTVTLMRGGQRKVVTGRLRDDTTAVRRDLAPPASNARCRQLVAPAHTHGRTPNVDAPEL